MHIVTRHCGNAEYVECKDKREKFHEANVGKEILISLVERGRLESSLETCSGIAFSKCSAITLSEFRADKFHALEFLSHRQRGTFNCCIFCSNLICLVCVVKQGRNFFEVS